MTEDATHAEAVKDQLADTVTDQLAESVWGLVRQDQTVHEEERAASQCRAAVTVLRATMRRSFLAGAKKLEGAAAVGPENR